MTPIRRFSRDRHSRSRRAPRGRTQALQARKRRPAAVWARAFAPPQSPV